MKIVKRCLPILFALLLLPVGGYAQSSSMTDDQVLNFIVKEHEKGTAQSQIVTKLVERGVPVSQIQRIRKKYEREQGNSQLGSRNISGIDDAKKRMRSNNGDTKDLKKNGERQKAKDVNLRNSSLTQQQKKRLMEEQEDNMGREMNAIFPDSLDYYYKEEMEETNKRKIFGHDIFNNKNLTFEPEMNIATPSDYRLGPGDAVYVDVWGASQKNFTATVSPDGNIDIEGFGPVAVSGLTVEQANSRVRSTLGSRYGGSNVRLSVGQTKTISVHVMGAVEVPGTYTLSAFATVFHALYMAGGTNEIGSLRDIRVYRNGRQVTTVDVYEYILNGNLKGNVRLASGDVIIVNPYNCLVNITGKVKRPMYYEMKSNESVATLIKYAGGFTGDAYRDQVRLVRKGGSNGRHEVYTIDEFERSNFQLADEDSVYVDSVLNRYSNMVEVRGAVFRPGMYQVDGNISTVRQLIEQAGGMTENAVKVRGVMHRRRPDRRLEVISVDLEGIWEHTVPDISLQNEDVLYVPSNKELLDQQKLTISGEVFYPGEYEYAENTTLEDLILQAGGLTDAASLVKVDVSRRSRDNTATAAIPSVSESFSFELKDGFVVKGTPGFTLQPFDEVFVRKSPGYVEQEHVNISGEVVFSGEYALTKKNYRLSDLIKEAGGLSPEAYANGARLLRVLTRAEKTQLESMLRASMSGDSIDVRKLDIGDTRYIGINLDKAIANPGNDQWDIVLRDGDIITVPQFDNTVSINGEVLYPNTVAYREKASLNYYINQAGGYSVHAKPKRVFTVNMNGTVSRVKSPKDIKPGCRIVVPAKSARKGMTLSEMLSLGSLTATLAAVIATLVK
jgi:protein involved in polysaccharide export with SLBB domain